MESYHAALPLRPNLDFTEIEAIRRAIAQALAPHALDHLAHLIGGVVVADVVTPND